MRGQRTEDDPDFYPLGVIYGAGYPGGCVLWPEFPLDRYTYDGGWDIYAAGSPPPQAWPSSARETARGQSRLRHGKVIFVTSTLRR
jgi:hypothetical protein